jgi:serine-type anaerobic sulfatase-maturating enzyme
MRWSLERVVGVGDRTRTDNIQLGKLVFYIELRPPNEDEIRQLEALRRRISGEEARLCTLAGACIGKHFLVEPNGDFAHCDLFLGDPAYTVGNVYESDFRAILQSHALIRLRHIEEGNQQSMSRCPYHDVCNGGCPHDRYIAIKYDPKYNEECCGSAT